MRKISILSLMRIIAKFKGEDIMTKIELAELIVSFAHWDGEKDPKRLCTLCSKDELQDIYEVGIMTEDDYYDEM